MAGSSRPRAGRGVAQEGHDLPVAVQADDLRLAVAADVAASDRQREAVLVPAGGVRERRSVGEGAEHTGRVRHLGQLDTVRAPAEHLVRAVAGDVRELDRPVLVARIPSGEVAPCRKGEDGVRARLRGDGAGRGGGQREVVGHRVEALRPLFERRGGDHILTLGARPGGCGGRRGKAFGAGAEQRRRPRRARGAVGRPVGAAEVRPGARQIRRAETDRPARLGAKALLGGRQRLGSEGLQHPALPCVLGWPGFLGGRHPGEHGTREDRGDARDRSSCSMHGVPPARPSRRCRRNTTLTPGRSAHSRECGPRPTSRYSRGVDTTVVPTSVPDALAVVVDAPRALLALGMPGCAACMLLPASLGELARARPDLAIAMGEFTSPADWGRREDLLWPRGVHVSRSSMPTLTLLAEGVAVASRPGGGPAMEIDAWLEPIWARHPIPSATGRRPPRRRRSMGCRRGSAGRPT